ncbi:MAG: membrane protein insertase YidC [Candidatus Omnitrophota bacterium]|jgi:YidC/Oxa1 family membrane protein insertase
MEKRLIIAIAFSIVIIVAFQNFMVKPNTPAKQQNMAQVTTPAALPEKVAETESPDELIANEKEFEVETDRYILAFSNIGGALKKISLKDFKKVGSDDILNLVDIKHPREYIFSLHSSTLSKDLDIAPYELEKKDGEIIYALKTGNIEVKKKYILHKSSNSIELQIHVRNLSAEPANFSYRLNGGSGMTEPTPADKRFVEVTSKIDGKILNFKNPKDKRIVNPGLVGWTALKNKYFSIILKPLGETKGEFYNETKDKSLVTGVESQDISIPAGSFAEQRFLLYAGPSKISELKAFGFNLEETINFGFFGFIAKIMLSIMSFFYSVVHSWGLSIIILSIFLNVLLFPLSKQSFTSMKKMQDLHPQMEKLKLQCKDNPQKLNKEMLELYKKYNINPLSGCLPLILQMPIFIALYQALIKSIDLRGAQFLWIRDLSAPDAVAIPFTLPLLGNSINILPILMIVGMVVQQKISANSMGAAVTDEQKQQQKMMLIIMPIMFGFIFYSMPSGLVLYWLINTVLTIVEQYVIFKKV